MVGGVELLTRPAREWAGGKSWWAALGRPQGVPWMCGEAEDVGPAMCGEVCSGGGPMALGAIAYGAHRPYSNLLRSAPRNHSEGYRLEMGPGSAAEDSLDGSPLGEVSWEPLPRVLVLTHAGLLRPWESLTMMASCSYEVPSSLAAERSVQGPRYEGVMSASGKGLRGRLSGRGELKGRM
ncbi:hypothetical protein CYMTET_38788 [Cymbomonas tetramitiformis]|uniref:Uncharacterized protein n=1 Tax=Cymbomonas tetramitiformis TaxID=36881 RepID=A0AAE0CBB4_9CHLO|nr:hypothetical protein CYMTET_38788 [Cymbomonas tetramitiformis]